MLALSFYWVYLFKIIKDYLSLLLLVLPKSRNGSLLQLLFHLISIGIAGRILQATVGHIMIIVGILIQIQLTNHNASLGLPLPIDIPIDRWMHLFLSLQLLDLLLHRFQLQSVLYNLHWWVIRWHFDLLGPKLQIFLLQFFDTNFIFLDLMFDGIDIIRK